MEKGSPSFICLSRVLVSLGIKYVVGQVIN